MFPPISSSYGFTGLTVTSLCHLYTMFWFNFSFIKSVNSKPSPLKILKWKLISVDSPWSFCSKAIKLAFLKKLESVSWVPSLCWKSPWDSNWILSACSIESHFERLHAGGDPIIFISLGNFCSITMTWTFEREWSCSFEFQPWVGNLDQIATEYCLRAIFRSETNFERIYARGKSNYQFLGSETASEISAGKAQIIWNSSFNSVSIKCFIFRYCATDGDALLENFGKYKDGGWLT